MLSCGFEYLQADLGLPSSMTPPTPGWIFKVLKVEKKKVPFLFCVVQLRILSAAFNYLMGDCREDRDRFSSKVHSRRARSNGYKV